MVRPLANVIGFRSDFSLDEHVMRHDWKVQAIQVVNLFGLSKLVTIRNA
jgi:phosphatidylethanolamine/phosphatidyl-N-methylethanolamine N-methyltransferase